MNQLDARDFGRLEEKVNALIERQRETFERVDDVRQQVEDVNKRVERWENRAVGALAVAGFIGSLLTWAASWLWQLWKH